ncbi:MAG: TetR/AcrR family transcriptional regulator [Deltaproteobacteria bacterium]|nr:TetR/AcrR family transcriptional regulator [Deltaproteobacteria bacterium]
MPRSSEDNQRIKDERREAILAAATRVFARRGLASTKIADIAHAAGLSHGLVYHYFESKEAIYVEVIRDILHGSRSALDECVAMEASPFERLAAFVRGVIARVEESPERLLLVLQVMVQDECSKGACAFFDDHAKHLYFSVRSLIVASREQGLIDPEGDPDALATALFAMIHGIAIGMLIDVPVPRRTPSVELVLRLLGPTRSAARSLSVVGKKVGVAPPEPSDARNGRRGRTSTAPKPRRSRRESA